MTPYSLPFINGLTWITRICPECHNHRLIGLPGKLPLDDAIEKTEGWVCPDCRSRVRCPYCHARFTVDPGVQYDLNAQLGASPVKCPDCEKEFKPNQKP